MAAVRRYDPFRELASLQERMNRIFDDTLSGTSRRDDEALAPAWTPPVDVLEKKDRIVLTAELPGFSEEQIRLRFEDGVLTLDGERRFEKEVDEARYHCVERSYGRFSPLVPPPGERRRGGHLGDVRERAPRRRAPEARGGAAEEHPGSPAAPRGRST